MENTALSCSNVSKPTREHVRDCMRQQQEATEHLLRHLQQIVGEYSGSPFKHDRAEYVRRCKRLEKAFELFRQADTQVHILIAGPGGAL